MIKYKIQRMAFVRYTYPFLVNKIQTFFIFATFISILLFLSLFPSSVLQETNGQSLITNDSTTKNQISNIYDLRYSILVNFTSKIDQIHGHLNASLMNKFNGNETFAVAHAGHPIAEIYPIIEPQITKVNSSLSESLYLKLLSLPELVKNSTNEAYAIEIETTKSILKQVINEVIPSNFQNDTTFNIFVIVDLLDIAGSEYQEAITNNTITAMVEYQDSNAFIQVAQKLLSNILLSNNSTLNVQNSNFTHLFVLLDSTIQKVSDPKQVHSSIVNIFLDLSKAIELDLHTLLSKLGTVAD
ncbi:hypothetical protein [Candidatus Nitrosocosmicus hydrocola]|uniref:hypothetical protein n=1 Tax=Candidatus Nitrosocosmicus hydrocola TaxID=1826872 RepID=UPI0011E5E1EA|nr:hypothetical protein [Candidatus Nitrosocosmicus hydrocola]